MVKQTVFSHREDWVPSEAISFWFVPRRKQNMSPWSEKKTLFIGTTVRVNRHRKDQRIHLHLLHAYTAMAWDLDYFTTTLHLHFLPLSTTVASPSIPLMVTASLHLSSSAVSIAHFSRLRVKVNCLVIRSLEPAWRYCQKVQWWVKAGSGTQHTVKGSGQV